MIREKSNAFHSSGATLPDTFVECECGHLESSHADYDADCVGDPPRFVPCPRPCHACDCRNFWSGE